MFNKDIQSDEELYASWFFEELKQRGFVREIIYQPKEFKLAEPVKFKWNKPKPTKKEPNRVEEKESALLEGVVYTADLKIIWEAKSIDIFISNPFPKSSKCPLFKAYLSNEYEGCYVTYHEVKPIFDDNNMTREVIIKHKWVYQIYGIYVNMFIRDKVMPKLFTPSRYIAEQVYKKTTKTKRGIMLPGMSKIQWNVRTLDEYLATLT